MKILVPTDFSKLSRVAVNWAAKMAEKLEAEIVLLNVIFVSTPPRAMLDLKAKAIEDAMVDNAKEDSLHLLKEIEAEHKGKLNISYEIIKGYPVEDVIESFATHNNIDLIIMGTKGASGLTKVLLGSNAAAVIDKSAIPVITVPEFARFKNLKHIIYPTDTLNINEELKAIIPLAQMFDATIHMLHIASPNSKKLINTELIIDEVKIKYPKVIFHISINDEILEGIDEYIADTKADMVVMFTHDLTFFEKLFGQSVSRKMIFHSWVPIYTIKKH